MSNWTPDKKTMEEITTNEKKKLDEKNERAEKINSAEKMARQAREKGIDAHVEVERFNDPAFDHDFQITPIVQAALTNITENDMDQPSMICVEGIKSEVGISQSLCCSGDIMTLYIMCRDVDVTLRKHLIAHMDKLMKNGKSDEAAQMTMDLIAVDKKHTKAIDGLLADRIDKIGELSPAAKGISDAYKNAPPEIREMILRTLEKEIKKRDL